MRVHALMLYGACALMSAPVIAEPATAMVEPTHATAGVPQLKYESAFGNYAPYREQPLAPWREVNDEVGRVGGHAGMFGGAGHAGHDASKTGSAKPPPAAPASASRQAPAQSPVRSAPAAPQPQHMGH